jgi:hypothetical protein
MGLPVCSLLRDLDLDVSTPIQMHCDNQAAIFIANNPIFHDRTKHIDIDCHFIQDLTRQKQIDRLPLLMFVSKIS